jgi:uncharacterized membrane protein
MRHSSLFFAIAIAISGAARADTVTFIPLQTQAVKVTKISGNGAYAVGAISYTAGFRWTASTGEEVLLPEMDAAQGINNDGTIAGAVPVNGGQNNNGDDLGAYDAIGGTPFQLTSPLQADSTGYDISDDGTVVGLSFGHVSVGPAVAFVWTAAAGMTALPVNRPATYSRANVISADGHVIAGWNDQANGSRTAVIWQDRVPLDVVDGSGNPVGEADGISPNGKYVVGSGGWRRNLVTGVVDQLPGMDFAFGVTDDGKTVVGNAGFFSTTYPQRAALIWQEGIGTIKLVDYLTAHGVTLPAGWEPNLAGGFAGISGNGTLMGGWSFGPNNNSGFIVKIVPDEIFADGYDFNPPTVTLKFAPTTAIAQGAPSTLTIELDNPFRDNATLTQDFVDQLPFGLVVASTPNASTTCTSGNLDAYADYDSVTLHAGATIPAGASCSITVQVTTNTAGDYTDVIPPGSLVTSTGNNVAAASASLHVLPPGGNGVVHSATLNHDLVNSGNGSTLNIITGQIDDTGPYTGPWDFNFYGGGSLGFWAVSTYSDAYAVDASDNIAVMQVGDTVGPASTFDGTNNAAATLWTAGADGYVGVRFTCDGRELYPVATGYCYGYLHLTTTATTGYPATLVSYSYDGDGNAITITP